MLEWLPLFAQPANVQILFDSLRYLQEQGRLTLYGYAILENHCHLLAAAPDLGKSIASFKSFTAGQIVKRLTERPCHLSVSSRGTEAWERTPNLREAQEFSQAALKPGEAGAGELAEAPMVWIG